VREEIFMPVGGEVILFAVGMDEFDWTEVKFYSEKLNAT
jgi:hypothetical protein